MSKELKKRIITSIFLISFTFVCIFLHPGIFFITLLLISYVAINEASSILTRIYKKFKSLVYFSVTFYLILIFIPSSFEIYKLFGSFYFLYILLVCIFSDIGGYFVGKNIGGKRLTKISPNKTISGSIGSFIFSTFPLLFFYNFNAIDYPITISNIIFCLQISLVSQLGDLFISYFKRKAKIKDTGKILPGHGGLLDRVDGIIFALPFVYIYLIGPTAYFEKWKSIILFNI